MEFFYGTVARLLDRHQALVDLAKFLQGDRESFFLFLENVLEFEKKLDCGTDVAESQLRLIATILKNRFKGIMVSQEWQRASDYFTIPSDESVLLDAYYRLDLGKEHSLAATEKLRRDLSLDAFFRKKSEKAQAKLDGVTIRFIFSQETPRWMLDNIDWQLDREKNRITGTLVISLGYPGQGRPPVYRDLFALYGQRQAASVIALRGVHKQDIAYQTMALEILQDVDFEIDEISRLLEDDGLRNGFERWQKKDLLAREFSCEGLSYLREVMASLTTRSHQLHYLKKRLQLSALELTQVEEPCEYEFSKFPKGKVIETLPGFGYYWPQDDCRQMVLPGVCRISAGIEPEFLTQIRLLAQDGVLSPRKNDLEAVTRMLLYLCLGHDKPRPPILPVYNALRRWLEALGNNCQVLEKICYHARVFRPHILIPYLGEKPFAIAKKEHKLTVRPDSQPEGIIIGIEQAGIIVPDVQMPLFLQGEYWVSQGGKEKQ